MTVTPFMMEDFLEWPTNTDVALFSGTNWSGGGLRVFSGAPFFSGKALFQANTDVGPGLYTLPPIAGVGLRVFCWNAVRTTDSTGGTPNSNGGSGWQFDMGTAGFFIRINANSQAVGLGSQYLLQIQRGLVGTFTTAFVSTNTYFTGTKIGFTFTYDPATGAMELFMNGILVFTTTDPLLAGKDIVAFRVGRQGTNASDGICWTGDCFGYVGSPTFVQLEVRSAFPAADLAATAWVKVGAGTNFACLGNLMSAAPAIFLSSAVINDLTEVTCPVVNTNVFQIAGAAQRYRANRTDVSPVDMHGEVGVGGPFQAGVTTDPPQTAYQTFTDYYGQINPISAALWTKADMANGQVGIKRTS